MLYYIVGGVILAKRNKSDWEKTVNDREQARWAKRFAEEQNNKDNDPY